MNPVPEASEPGSPGAFVEAAAAAWLSLRDRGMNPAETAEFIRWLQQDPRHAKVFAELDATWNEFDRLGTVPTSQASVAPDPEFLSPRPRLRRRRRTASVALGAAAAIALLLVAIFHPDRSAHETAVGGFQKLDLPDGSIAQINTDSTLDFSFTETARQVRILRGEVYFTVARDAGRPFVVTAGPVVVQAVGTAFNVHRRSSSVEVLVTEGRVRLDDAAQGHSLLVPAAASGGSPVLSAGERATVTVASELPPAKVVKVSPAETRRLLAWQERRLEFDAVPLADVVREFNRYNRQQLAIADAALAEKRFSGTFRADGYESLVRLLENDFGVRAQRGEREIVLRRTGAEENQGGADRR